MHRHARAFLAGIQKAHQCNVPISRRDARYALSAQSAGARMAKAFGHDGPVVTMLRLAPQHPAPHDIFPIVKSRVGGCGYFTVSGISIPCSKCDLPSPLSGMKQIAT
jgi:hypothetical protein